MEEKEREKIEVTVEMDDMLTGADLHGAILLNEEMGKAGIQKGSYVRRKIVEKYCAIMVGHREEVQDMYKRSKKQFEQYILEVCGVNTIKAFKKMGEIGFKGNIVHDLDLLERIEK